MKSSIQLDVKEYFWNTIRKFTNTFSNLTVNNLGNGYIKCLWELSYIDNLRVKFSKSCFFAIRLFDISNSRNRNHATCIMKEIQISKFQSSISFPIPVNTGVYYFEFGYRKRNGDWRKLAYQDLNLGYRVKKILQNSDKNNWFDFKNSSNTIYEGFHEKAYQLSLHSSIGGSENLSYD
tara:strand:+ start:306 stop:839 length:534 start_codon:yes stop_codon:yes gene_type:complete